MGVKGLWDILLPAAQQRSLDEIAVNEGFAQNRHGRRAIIIGVDAALWIWQSEYAFKVGHAQAGENPELRTIFYKLAHLLQFPVALLFIFDGPNRPRTKRGKTVITTPNWLVRLLQEMLDAFGIQYYDCPGEADTELAYLNASGIIDAVITEDSDSLVFGATRIIRNFTSRCDRVTIYSSECITNHQDVRLTRGGMILIALLSGGDYDKGLPGFGPKIGLGLAHAGFGDSLFKAALTLPRQELKIFLKKWRHDLRTELRTNAKNKLPRPYPTLAGLVPESFPSVSVLMCYVKPTISLSEHFAGVPGVQPNLSTIGPCRPNLRKLASLCERRFSWENTTGGILKRFRTLLWDGMSSNMLAYGPIAGEGSGLCFEPSDICRIRLSRPGPQLKSNILFFRIDFTTNALEVLTLSGITNVQHSALLGSTSTSSAWIASPILGEVRPDLVTAFFETHHARHPPLTPPPLPVRKWISSLSWLTTEHQILAKLPSPTQWHGHQGSASTSKHSYLKPSGVNGSDVIDLTEPEARNEGAMTSLSLSITSDDLGLASASGASEFELGGAETSMVLDVIDLTDIDLDGTPDLPEVIDLTKY